MKKVLFIAMHRKNRSPSQRYRFEQYFNYLEENGIKCTLSFLISEKEDNLLYKPGHYLAKLKIYLKSILARRKDLRTASTFDFIFIQREALMTRSTFFERKLANLNVPIIYDFDDAIWLEDKNSNLGILGLLKYPAKTAEIMGYADKIIAGNSYLANYALKYNANVKVIPTTIDTNWYKPKEKYNGAIITIGWTGSFSTIKHFEELVPVLVSIKAKYHDRINFLVIGCEEFIHDDLDIKGLAWSADSEVEDLQAIDIGIMPLPNNDWTKGKCGAKGLQYMGLAIPTIMSPVGVNTEIIQDGINGFLADTDDQWFNKLSLLIESEELRTRLGKAGRETVVKHYSLETNKEKYLKLFD